MSTVRHSAVKPRGEVLGFIPTPAFNDSKIARSYAIRGAHLPKSAVVSAKSRVPGGYRLPFGK